MIFYRLFRQHILLCFFEFFLLIYIQIRTRFSCEFYNLFACILWFFARFKSQLSDLCFFLFFVIFSRLWRFFDIFRRCAFLDLFCGYLFIFKLSGFRAYFLHRLTLRPKYFNFAAFLSRILIILCHIS